MRILKKIFLFMFRSILVITITFIFLGVCSWLFNFTLPDRSDETKILSGKDKAYVAEAGNILARLGNETWPGWGASGIPVVLYNEEYAFLVGFDNPPDGWQKMPAGILQGGPWEVVEEDSYYGSKYYRQFLPLDNINPENFTVRIGDRWAVSMQTREFSAVSFYKGFRYDLPPFLRPVFPYKLFWNILMGESENYIGALLHESFHAFQGSVVPHRLKESEEAARLYNDYPWNEQNNADGWIEEVDHLIKAYNSADYKEKRMYVDLFLDRRERRRNESGLKDELIECERRREWLEGLAKYAELKTGLIAERSTSYNPVKELAIDDDFCNYKKRSRYFANQIMEARHSAARAGETRFYYVGFLQAAVLDQLMPEWKLNAFNDGVYLEDLLKEYVNDTSQTI